MNKHQTKSIKLFILIGVSLIAAAVGYFRFFHSPQKTEDSSVTVHSASDSLNEDGENMINSEDQQPIPFVSPEKMDDLRDIFLMPKKSSEDKDTTFASFTPLSHDIPPLSLNGIIHGEGPPLAVINNRHVRVGERIEGFLVLSIGKEDVVLEKDLDRIELSTSPIPKDGTK